MTTRAYLAFAGSVTPPTGARKWNGVAPSRMFEGTSNDSTCEPGHGLVRFRGPQLRADRRRLLRRQRRPRPFDQRRHAGQDVAGRVVAGGELLRYVRGSPGQGPPTVDRRLPEVAHQHDVVVVDPGVRLRRARAVAPSGPCARSARAPAPGRRCRWPGRRCGAPSPVPSWPASTHAAAGSEPDAAASSATEPAPAAGADV